MVQYQVQFDVLSIKASKPEEVLKLFRELLCYFIRCFLPLFWILRGVELEERKKYHFTNVSAHPTIIC